MREIRGYAQMIVETDEENPKVIAKITNEDIDVVDGYRIRLRPVYEEEKEIENE